MITQEDWKSIVRNNGHDIEEGLLKGLENYLFHRIPTGSFLNAVLENRFHEAITRAHPCLTLSSLKALCYFIDNFLPASAHGSPSIVAEWLEGKHKN